MAAPGLAGPAKKALAILDREWDGLTAHQVYPMISLDNNAAERMIRGPIVTRKNTGGSATRTLPGSPPGSRPSPPNWPTSTS
jgi:transposase